MLVLFWTRFILFVLNVDTIDQICFPSLMLVTLRLTHPNWPSLYEMSKKILSVVGKLKAVGFDCEAG